MSYTIPGTSRAHLTIPKVASLGLHLVQVLYLTQELLTTMADI
jgi:hypothetical protein